MTDSDSPPGALVSLTCALVGLLLISISAEKRGIPSSAACISLGALIGVLLGPTGLAQRWGVHETLEVFNGELFYYVLLPPVIFEAGFSLQKRPFFRNIGTILWFAVLGTLLTLVAIGLPLYAIGKTGAFRDAATGADALDFRTPLDAFLFAGCVSATDPVATLSIMGAMGVEERLYAIVFGESVLNDAVAIVLVNILESLGESGFTHPAHFLVGVGWFLLISIGSLLTGIVLSAASALVLKWVHVELARHASFEVGLIFLFGYLSYAVAEAIGCSGILALFVSGVLESHYHVYSLSESGRSATAIALKALAHLFETIIFSYVGLEIFFNRPTQYMTALANASTAGVVASGEPGDPTEPGVVGGWPVVGFVAVATALVLASRIAVVPPLCLLANCLWLRRQPLRLPTCTAIVAAGLRGAIAFALAKSTHSAHHVNITAATVGSVVVTVFVVGGSTRRLLSALGLVETNANAREVIKARDDQTHTHQQERVRAALLAEPSTRGGMRTTLRRVLGRWLQWLRSLDEDVLQPLFIAADVETPKSHVGSGESAGTELVSTADTELASAPAASPVASVSDGADASGDGEQSPPREDASQGPAKRALQRQDSSLRTFDESRVRPGSPRRPP